MTIEVQLARMPGTGEIPRLLVEMREGDPKAAEELLSYVCRELRALAACKMALEAPGQTLQPAALAQKAWLRLVGGKGQRTPGRASPPISSRKMSSGGRSGGVAVRKLAGSGRPRSRGVADLTLRK